MSESDNIAHIGVASDGSSHGASLPTPDSTPDSGFKKPRCTRSKIWEHFTIQEKNPDRANCNYCDAELGCKSSSSGTKYITSNTFFEEIAAVNYLLDEWSDRVICVDDEIFKNMAAKMKDKYDKYWGDPENMNKYIFIAAILDPRTKESHFFKDLVEDTYGSTKEFGGLQVDDDEIISGD